MMVKCLFSKIPDYLRSPEAKLRYNRELFNKIAGRYDLLNKILSFGADSVWKDSVVAMLPEVQGPNCLDVACGTGDVTFRLSGKYPKAKIYGVDLSTSMLDIARSKNHSKDVNFVLADMCDLPFSDNSFDLITGCYALRNAADIYQALTEFRRVLKPGGKACFMDFSKPSNRFSQRIEYLLLKLWGGFWGWMFHKDMRSYGYIAESLRLFPDSNELKKILIDKGFKNLSSKKYCFGIVEAIMCEKVSNQ